MVNGTVILFRSAIFACVVEFLNAVGKFYVGIRSKAFRPGLLPSLMFHCFRRSYQGRVDVVGICSITFL